jgi:putative tryptophan/tyrosine transport system substrate-binding protein
MRRREFITLIGGAAASSLLWPPAARAQQPERVWRVGVLMPLAKSDREAQRRIEAFGQSLRELGWAEGRNVAFEVRYADGDPRRLPALAKELVEAKVDLIITQAAEPVNAARGATGTIPIVMASHGDAVGAGVVASLARPGGNVTGQTLVATEQAAKRLDLIKKVNSAARRAAVLWNGNAAGHRLQMQAMELAAPVLGIALQSLPTRTSDEIDAALQAATAAQAQFLVTMDDPFIQSNRARIAEFGLRQRLPVVGEFRVFVEAGALLSYAPNQIDLWRGSATYVDRIFRGTKPADLPVSQPTKFELVINLKTAKALGLDLPDGLLAIADEVIE